MSVIGYNRPEWLEKAAFDDSFDWSNLLKSTFETFFDHVTLHDSNWETVTLNLWSQLVLTIKLDAFWNKEYCERTENTNDWPYLVIKVPNTVNVSFHAEEFRTMTISHSETKRIDNKQIEILLDKLANTDILPQNFYKQLINCKQLTKTRFDDINGGYFEVLHDAEIELLLINQDGKYIDPDLRRVQPFSDIKHAEAAKESFIRTIWTKLTRI